VFIAQKTPFSKQNTALKGCEHTRKSTPKCIPNYIPNPIFENKTSKNSQPLPYRFNLQIAGLSIRHLTPD
jgi:hypothetical protein